MPTAGQDIGPRAVFVLGASSSGKTTLCNALAQDLQLESELYIREVARNVMKTQGFSRKHTHLYEMQEAIMLAQLQAERSATEHTSNEVRRGDILLLSDRSAIDPVVYAATSGTSDAKSMRQRLLETPSLQQNMAFYRRSLFVVLQPVADWIIDDGIRSLQDPLNYTAQLCLILTELDISFIVIPEELKNLDERVALVKSHLIPRLVLQRFIDFDQDLTIFHATKPSIAANARVRILKNCLEESVDLRIWTERGIWERKTGVLRDQGIRNIIQRCSGFVQGS